MAAHPSALFPAFALLLLGAALPADRAQLSTTAKLVPSNSSIAVPKLRGGAARVAHVPVNAAALNASTRSETTVAQSEPSCHVGQNVYAPYGEGGQFAGGVISRIGLSGEVEVDWYNSDPNHRHIQASRLLPPCVPISSRPLTGKEEAARRRSEAPPAAIAAVASPTIGKTAAQHLMAPGQVPAQHLAQTQGSGMLHFLFLVNDQLPHLDLWQKFFASAPANSWTAKVHCKDPEACRYSGLLDVPGLEMVETTPTYYCHDLVTAMARLLEAALAKSLGMPGSVEKFIFVSDSTLPVKPFAEIQAYLLADNDSDFCLFPRDQWATANVDGHDIVLAKHHQWVVLNRPHAELFVREWVPVDARGVWHVWLRGGSWAGQERYLSPQHFHRPPRSNTCADEWAFVATIFGAIEPETGSRELPGFGGGAFHVNGRQAYTTQGRCRTFTFWDVNDGPAFASLAKEVDQDWGSSMSCYPHCTWRPAKFDELSTASLTAMRHSEFLFVRKFSPWISLPQYEHIVIR